MQCIADYIVFDFPRISNDDGDHDDDGRPKTIVETSADTAEFCCRISEACKALVIIVIYDNTPFWISADSNEYDFE